MKEESGFTLVELMVTLVVAGILLTVGIPSLLETMRTNRMAAQVNQLVSALNLARSEAIKRGRQVTILRTGAQWEDGWSVFSDEDADGVFDDDGDADLCEAGEDCEQRVYGPLGSGFTLRTGGNFANWVAYLPTGQSRGSPGNNDTFRLCADDMDTNNSREIVINRVGRVRTAEGTDSCP